MEDQNRPRYNIAPSQQVLVLRTEDEGEAVIRATMKWGFVPSWEKSEKPKLAPINAKSESVATSGMFRQSLQKRRCLIPADGFYEWRRLSETLKIPFDIHLKGNGSFFMAGIFEKGTDTRPATFAILTTTPNELMATIHDRMPAMLDDDEAKRWLQPGALSADELAQLTQPYPTDLMEAVAISTLVNNPRNDTPEVLIPAEKLRPEGAQGEFFEG